MLERYEALARRVLVRPGFTAIVILAGVALILCGLFPFLGRAYFPRTDPGQFVINVKMPSGTRLGVSDQYVARVENIVRQIVRPTDLGMIVSNIGVYPDLSAIYTSNASMDTAFVQVSLKQDHEIGSYRYMARVRQRLSAEMPELTTYFQAGGLVDSVINQGLPAPIDIQVSSMNMHSAYALAQQMARTIKAMPNVSDVYIPQDLNYPGLALNIDRERASQLGLSAQNVVDNVITAMTSRRNDCSFLLDRSQERQQLHGHGPIFHSPVQHMNLDDFENIPLRGSDHRATIQTSRSEAATGAKIDKGYTPLQSVAQIHEIDTPTEVDHYQIRRVIDIYVATKTEALEKVGKQINRLIAHTTTDRNTRAHYARRGGEHERCIPTLRSGAADLHRAGVSHSDGAVHLVYRSFYHPDGHPSRPGRRSHDPAAHRQHAQHHVADGRHHDDRHRGLEQHSYRRVLRHSARAGLPLLEATVEACKVRLRPILMTSLATLLGMIPMALGYEAGSEQYAPLARAIIGGLGVSVVVTVFLVPAVYLVIHTRRQRRIETQKGAEA